MFDCNFKFDKNTIAKHGQQHTVYIRAFYVIFIINLFNDFLLKSI